MRKTKIPLELVLNVSVESGFDEITVLSQKKLGLSHHSIAILLRVVDQSIQNFDFKLFCQCLRNIHGSLINIPLDTDLMKVSLILTNSKQSLLRDKPKTGLG
jgi:hypothetical protein